MINDLWVRRKVGNKWHSVQSYRIGKHNVPFFLTPCGEMIYPEIPKTTAERIDGKWVSKLVKTVPNEEWQITQKIPRYSMVCHNCGEYLRLLEGTFDISGDIDYSVIK